MLSPDKKLWNTLVRRMRDDYSRYFRPDNSVRLALQGHCYQTSKVLSEIIGGELVSGLYFGPAILYKNGPHWNWSELWPKCHGHHWVEKNGLIYDPTWWAFTKAELGIYIFQPIDPRYSRK